MTRVGREGVGRKWGGLSSYLVGIVEQGKRGGGEREGKVFIVGWTRQDKSGTR